MTGIDKQAKVDTFKHLFLGRTDVYGRHDPEVKKSWQEKAPLTDKVFSMHLFGKQPCGVYLLKTSNMCSAVVADFDKPETAPIIEFMRRAHELDLFVYPEISKSKGWHIWIFFQSDVQAAKPRRIVRHILTGMELDKIVEVFPKHDSINSTTFYGNFINLPLANVYISQGRTVFLDEDLSSIPDQWQFLEQIKRVPESILDSIIIRLTRNHEDCSSVRPVNSFQSMVDHNGETRKTFGLLPCAIRMLSEGVTEMQRKSAFRLAVNLKKAGLPMSSAVSVLMEWRKRNRPADGRQIITQEEINEQTKAAYARQYASCGCDDEAMRRYCDEKCILKKGTGMECR